MAEAQNQKAPSLAEQYSLQEIEKQLLQVESPVKPTEDEKSDNIVAEDTVIEKIGGVSPAEESDGAPEQEDSIEQEAAIEAPEIKLETTPADIRFPTTNQTRHCFTRYIEYHRCTAAKGEGAPECEKFAKYYRSLCPGEWIERWNEQRENGTFPGPL